MRVKSHPCLPSTVSGALTIAERLVIVPNEKRASPTWTDVRVALLRFDRAGLQGLVHDLYAASKDNQAFLHVRLGLGADHLKPYRASISDGAPGASHSLDPFGLSGGGLHARHGRRPRLPQRRHRSFRRHED